MYPSVVFFYLIHFSRHTYSRARKEISNQIIRRTISTLHYFLYFYSNSQTFCFHMNSIFLPCCRSTQCLELACHALPLHLVSPSCVICDRCNQPLDHAQYTLLLSPLIIHVCLSTGRGGRSVKKNRFRTKAYDVFSS